MSTQDVYEALGVSPDADAQLAREMYWMKVGRLRQAEKAGDPHAPRSIDRLNEALAIVLDPSRRASYDAEHVPAPVGPVTHVPSSKRTRRAWLAAALVLGVAGGSLYLQRAYGWQPAATVLVVGLVFLGLAAIGMRREPRRVASAFASLHLAEGATLEDIDTAYRLRAQHLLARATVDPVARAQLDGLDDAYRRAQEAASVDRASGVSGPRRERGSGGAVGRAVATMAGWPLSLARAGVEVLRRRTATRVHVRQEVGRSVGPTRSGRSEPSQADVRRRLAQAGRDEGPATAAPTEDDAYLVVEGGGAAPQRVLVGSHPVRVGSSPACDLVLPAADAAPEHLTVWQRGRTLVLHVVEGGSSCEVNGEAVSWAVLEDGDTVRVGETLLRVEFAP